MNTIACSQGNTPIANNYSTEALRFHYIFALQYVYAIHLHVFDKTSLAIKILNFTQINSNYLTYIPSYLLA